MTREAPGSLPPENTKQFSRTGQKTADEILAAAEKLFTLKGYKATTLKEVSESSGANTALISYYFGSKEGLRDAIFNKHLQLVGSGFEALFKTPVETFTLDSFREFIKLCLKFGTEDQTMFRLVIWGMVDNEDLAVRMADAVWQPFFNKLRDILVHLSNNQLSSKNAEVRVWLILAMVQGYIQGHWHSVNHMKIELPKEEFFAKYSELIASTVIDNLVKP